jgi:hypothetical protein
MDDQLNPRTDVDGDKATSRLLEPRETPRTTAHHNNDTKGPVTDHQGDYTSYDQVNLRASYEDGKAANDERYTSSTAVLWKGLPRYLLTWELVSITLSLCFLGLRIIPYLNCNIANNVAALGASLASLQGKPESPWSARVMQASRIAPSIWPIVFSGVLGNAMRAFADYRVERGVSLLVCCLRMCPDMKVKGTDSIRRDSNNYWDPSRYVAAGYKHYSTWH